jgi:hypothetical protein
LCRSRAVANALGRAKARIELLGERRLGGQPIAMACLSSLRSARVLRNVCSASIEFDDLDFGHANHDNRIHQLDTDR